MLSLALGIVFLCQRGTVRHLKDNDGCVSPKTPHAMAGLQSSGDSGAAKFRASSNTTTRNPEPFRDLDEDLEQARGEATPPTPANQSHATATTTHMRLQGVQEWLENAHLGPPGPPIPSAEAIISRLKRECDSAALAPTDVRRRLRHLRRDERAAAAFTPPVTTTGLIKVVCSTDLLFLMDTTRSMRDYIEAAKSQVRSVVDDLGVAFYREAEIRIAVVGYKDHMDSPNIQFLDFTSSVSTVHSFLDRLDATGGDDPPEDVLGGLRQALEASWMHQTRCIIHIADAPPHGRTLHDLGDSDDLYPNPGSEPHKLTHQALFSQLTDLHINYALLRINGSTDLMAYNMLLAYQASSASGSLLPANKYFGQVKASPNDHDALGGRGLLFQEAELGTTLASLRHLVVRVVTASAARTGVGHVTRMTRTAAMAEPSRGLAPIIKGSKTKKKLPLDFSTPQWDYLVWFDQKLVAEGFGLEAVVHGATTLDSMMASDDNIRINVLNMTILKRRFPFAKGAVRFAFHARTWSSTHHYVAKIFQRPGERLPLFTEGMRCHALCKAFAIEFNSLVKREHSIDFAAVACFDINSSSSTVGDTCISLEPFLEGAYVKYNGNTGYVGNEPDDPVHQAAQAFSHFTFERSRGYFLVCDLQGVGNILTDPVVHSIDRNRFKLSRTNLGLPGMKLFFSSHECNDLCRQLGLQSNQAMLASGTYTFRETWPVMGDVVCCSNKLCRRILRRSAAHTAPAFPGHRWCDRCLPQLKAFSVKWLCVEPGPPHEFELSRFFFESQGLIAPRRCPEHRGGGAKAAGGC
ncbi:hypothetical protein B0T16DRAFT_511437 [Cercophora newfieldiana]|uniref:Alpha-type protein kinase domain-containing protein n=1 Tax=Cercophora newfieldiana TaxID=92897 RepID=A0AA39Y6D7_9PEZI|nr:hypothetical protein B0T16DRAFT_511437 [Cercophora newfieldiana]